MAWRGLAIGLIISAPMGPVGMLCIQRTLDKGRRAGLFTGIGAAISDFFYCLLTGFGLSFIEEFLEKNSNVIQLAGSVVLIAFGVYLFRKNPSQSLKKPTQDHVSVKKSILGGFFFTFSNPLILFLTIGLFARFNFLLPEFKIHQYFTGFIFIFIGAVLWWWLITFAVDKVRSHFNIRSMWLINKIIGVIILLFAVVGIITATSALVEGAETKCWNAKRGYSSFSPLWVRHGSPDSGRMANGGADTLRILTDADHADAMEFRFKARCAKPSASRGWGIEVRGAGGSPDVTFDITPSENVFDGVSSSQALKVTTRVGGSQVSSGLFSDTAGLVGKLKNGAEGPDPSGTHNFFKLILDGGSLDLYGGIHTPVALARLDLGEGFRADSVGFFLAPKAEVEFYDISLEAERHSPASLVWDDSELLGEYLSNSRDVMEGYWRILDRSLEESLLKPGGDYSLACVRAEDGYDFIYLSGAVTNASGWAPGMVKASLRPSGIGGVWNVRWFDATHRPLFHDVKAQRDIEGVLTIQFPYHNSQLRLLRIN